MKVHFTIEFPTRSGEPVDYENDVDVMNPKISMQPEFPNGKMAIQSNQDIKNEEIKESEPVEVTEEINEDEFNDFKARLEKGEIDNEELKQTIEKYQQKNLELTGRLHSTQMEVAKMKAIMKKAPDEQIEELIQENDQLRKELKEKLQERAEENQEDASYLREEIKELRGKLKERDERIEKMIESEREAADQVIKFRTQVEKTDIELREQKAKMEEKYKHFEELNKYISDLLHEKKKLGLSMDEKTTQWQEMKNELEEMKKRKDEEYKRIENEVQQKSLEDNQKRWDEFQNKIADKDKELEEMKKQLKLADEAMNKEGDDVKLVREAGEGILSKIEELEDICEIMNIEFDRTDVDELRHKAKGMDSEQYARGMKTYLKIIGDRQQAIYNNVRG
jgi:DNA repair exonuclease SbcCD ATPase subunit